MGRLEKVVEEHFLGFIRYISGSDHIQRTVLVENTKQSNHEAHVGNVWGVQGCTVNYKVSFTLMTS